MNVGHRHRLTADYPGFEKVQLMSDSQMVKPSHGPIGSDMQPHTDATTETSPGIATQLALIRADIEEIRHILHGDGKSRKGLADKVEELAAVADRGCFGFRAALWLGGGIVAAVTAIASLKEAVVELFRQ